MDLQIALLLGQDGIVNGAVYGLMALALVLVFSVTRVIFIPQGELVAFGALSMAALNAGRVPATLWLLVALAAATLAVEGWRWKRGATVEWMSTLVWTVAFPALAAKLHRMHSEEPTLTVADLAGYPGPALVMVGDDEDEIPMEHILALRQGLPRSQLAVVPGAGHGLPVDKPELFNRLVVDFLTGDTDGGDR